MKNNDKRTYQIVRFKAGESNLGDLILMSQGYRERNDILVVLPVSSAHFAPLFQNLAPVLVTDLLDIPCDPPTQSPYVRLSPEEVAFGKSAIANIRRPIAICPNCSPAWRHVRECPLSNWTRLCDHLRDSGFTPIQFGLSATATPIPNTRTMFDLPLRQLASIYAAIGLYAGVDTGDRWLMLAVGGRTIVAHPPDSSNYPFKNWHKTCDGRAIYVPFSRFDTLYDLIARQ